jgi:hypothetical protein
MERLGKLRMTDRDGLLCLTAAILALMVVLLLAASARADVGAPETAATTTGTQEPSDSQSPTEPASAEGQSPATEEAPPEAAGTAPSGAGEEPAASAAPEEQVTPTPEEQAAATPEGQVSTGVTEEQAPVETATEGQSAGPSLPVEETTAGPSGPEEAVLPAEVTKEVTQEAPLETVEEPKTPAGERAEGGNEAGLSMASRASLDAPPAQLDMGRADSAAAEAPVSSGAALPIIAMIAGTEIERPPPGGGPTGSARAGMTSAQRAGDFSCELSQLGGHLTDNCAAGWLGAPRFVSVAPTGLVTIASSLVATTIAGSTSQGGHGGSAVSSPPIGSAPGPAPGGAAGAATGASGGTAPLSTFLTLAGLLLLGAPRVLRRLRLSCEPWLAGCFVLVPERPD